MQACFFVYTYSTHESSLHIALQICFHATGWQELCGLMFERKRDLKWSTFFLLQPGLSMRCKETPASYLVHLLLSLWPWVLEGCSSYFFTRPSVKCIFTVATPSWLLDFGVMALELPSLLPPLLAPCHIIHTSDRASKLKRKKRCNCNDIQNLPALEEAMMLVCTVRFNHVVIQEKNWSSGS